MRWIWIDRILELEHGNRCVAIKNVTSGEDVLHDHFPATDQRPAVPVMPNTLIIEGMAQTAGILVGRTGDFREKVILAKIARADFEAAAYPGFTLRHTAILDNFGQGGAATSGRTELIDPVEGKIRHLAQIDLVFSHLDHAQSGLEFPDHNFVFTSQFMDLLRESGLDSSSEAILACREQSDTGGNESSRFI